jgi:hypothetical protein
MSVEIQQPSVKVLSQGNTGYVFVLPIAQPFDRRCARRFSRTLRVGSKLPFAKGAAPMLEDLRYRAAAALTWTHMATMATHGPAGLQADLVPCAAQDLRLFLLVPSTSEHLLNLEANPELVLATATWRARGRVRKLSVGERPAIVALSDNPTAPWCVWLEVAFTRLTITHVHGWGAAETIDIAE